MPVIEIRGLASQRSRFIEVNDSDLDTDLLTWLRANEVMIASSCDGEGVCKNVLFKMAG